MTNDQIATAPHPASDSNDVEKQALVMEREKLERLQNLHSKLAATLVSKQRMTAKVETMRRARLAAQTDAGAARDRWREKLRDSDGTLTRDVQKLRVAERAALSLIEEYEALEAELGKDMPRLELEAADAASELIRAHNAALRQAADQAYEQALAQATDSLALAFELHCSAANAGLSYANRSTREHLADQFFTTVGKHVRGRVSGDELDMRVSAFMNLPLLNLQDVDMELAGSPALRAKLRAKLQAEVL